MTERLLRTVFLWQFVHCKKSSSAVSYRQKPELHTSLEQQFCRYTFPRVFLNFLLTFPNLATFLSSEISFYTEHPRQTRLPGVFCILIQYQRTRHGRLWSYFQPGIRYCIAFASSLSWEGSFSYSALAVITRSMFKWTPKPGASGTCSLPFLI